jgi:hypothetical protein
VNGAEVMRQFGLQRGCWLFAGALLVSGCNQILGVQKLTGTSTDAGAPGQRGDAQNVQSGGRTSMAGASGNAGRAGHGGANAGDDLGANASGVSTGGSAATPNGTGPSSSGSGAAPNGTGANPSGSAATPNGTDPSSNDHGATPNASEPSANGAGSGGSNPPSSGTIGSGSAATVGANGAGSSAADGGGGAHGDGSSAGGSPAAGSGDQAGNGTTPSNPQSTGPAAVSGTVIDQSRQPWAGVEVRIGTLITQTDALGQFSFDAVAPTYDISFTANAAGGQCSDVWRYENMTVRNPVLQGVNTHADQHASYALHLASPAFPLIDGASLRVALGSSKPAWSFPSVDLTSADTSLSADWTGASDRLDATLHALEFYPDLDTGSEPNGLGYQSTPIALAPTTASASLSVPSAPLAALNLWGYLMTDGARPRKYEYWLRWPDDARMRLISVADDTDPDFLWNVPTPPDGGVCLVGWDGSAGTTAYAYGVIENITTEKPDLMIALPTPPMIALPAADATGVDANTTFQWSSSEPIAIVDFASDTGCLALHVVTSNKSVALPVAPRTGVALPATTQFDWRVSSSGPETSVDAAASAAGQTGIFRFGLHYGTDRASNSRSVSEQRAFTTAP